MSGGIANHKSLLDGVAQPIQVKSFVQAPLNILRCVGVPGRFCLSLAYKVFNELDIVRKLLNCKSCDDLDVTVPDECDTNIESRILTLDCVNDLFESVFTAYDPARHAGCAVHQQA